MKTVISTTRLDHGSPGHGFRFHMEQASQYREALDVNGLAELRRNARHNHEPAWSDGWRKPVRETLLSS
jgi:hypothetical protein